MVIRGFLHGESAEVAEVFRENGRIRSRWVGLMLAARLGMLAFGGWMDWA
jgi:hypothetical protein